MTPLTAFAPHNVPPDWDRHFSATRNPSGTWNTPGTNTPAYLSGGYTRCGYGPGNPGPIGDLDVVQAGSRYYMAFNGGNADFIVGRTYWAASDDGVTWTVYNVNPPAGEVWAPLVRPRDHECFNGANVPPTQWNDIPGGITEQYLAFEPADLLTLPEGDRPGNVNPVPGPDDKLLRPGVEQRLDNLIETGSG